MKRKKCFLQSSFLITILGISIICSTSVFGAMIQVPYDYPTLQSGLDAANPGDTVLVNIDFKTFPDGTSIIGDINHETHIFNQFEPFGIIFPNLYPGWFYPAPRVAYNPDIINNDIRRFGILISGGPTGFFGDIEMDFVGSLQPTFVTVEIIGSGLNIGASLTAFNQEELLIGTNTHFYYGNTGINSPFTITAPCGETIATVIYNGGLNPSAAASIDNLIFGFVLPPLEVPIDIRPWSKRNPINYRGHGILPVAILSTEDFDAHSQVDQNSLTFGATGKEKSLAFCNPKPRNISRDGSKDDLVCHFYIAVAGFKCGDTEGILKGKTLSGIPIEGEDLVRIINCK